MEDIIAKKFMENIRVLAQKRFGEYSEKIRTDYVSEASNISDELLVSLKAAAERYRLMEAESQVGPMEYLYLSFMWTSVLLDIPHYRIDMYDGKGRCALQECAVEWNCEYIFQYFQMIKEELRNEFSSQNRVKGYEMEVVIFETAERFKQLVNELLPEAVKELVPRFKDIYGLSGRIKIYLGEFLDKAELILECFRGDIVIEEVDRDWGE